jgi:hypothetical protein
VSSPRSLFVLTLVNLGVLAFQLVGVPSAEAKDPDAILRGRGLEIVDEQGRVRVQLKVEPANSAFKMPDGTTGYPETVILRLITADGKPRVKLTTSVQSSGLMLLGDSDDTQAILGSHGAKASLLLRNTQAQQRVLTP